MTPFKALLVEGTSGVGKSTLIDALLRRHAASAQPRKIRTILHLAQSHTYGPLAVPEDRGTLTVDANLQHLANIGRMLQWLHESVQEHVRTSCFVLIDTLHLTHCVRPGVVGWGDVEPFDHRLAALGCKLLFLRASAAAIWERGIVPRMGEQFLEEYARKFGHSYEEIHRHFIREQETLTASFSRSLMPKLLLQSDEQDAGSLTEQAFHFWNEESDMRKAA